MDSSEHSEGTLTIVFIITSIENSVIIYKTQTDAVFKNNQDYIGAIKNSFIKSLGIVIRFEKYFSDKDLSFQLFDLNNIVLSRSKNNEAVARCIDLTSVIIAKIETIDQFYFKENSEHRVGVAESISNYWVERNSQINLFFEKQNRKMKELNEYELSYFKFLKKNLKSAIIMFFSIIIIIIFFKQKYI